MRWLEFVGQRAREEEVNYRNISRNLYRGPLKCLPQPYTLYFIMFASTLNCACAGADDSDEETEFAHNEAEIRDQTLVSLPQAALGAISLSQNRSERRRWSLRKVR